MRILRIIVISGIGCFLIGLTYLVVLRLSWALWRSSLNPSYQQYRPGIGLDIEGFFLAVPLITVPYIIGGIFLGLLGISRYALPIGLITILSERLLILGAAIYVLGQFRQVTESGDVTFVEGGPHLILAIRSEALPYFGWGYILLGIPTSILILYFIARGLEQNRRRRVAITVSESG
jgi:hypothetical protein